MNLPGFSAEASVHGMMPSYNADWAFDLPGNRVWPQACDDPTCLANCQANCPDPGNCWDLPPAARLACERAAFACLRGCYSKCCIPCTTPPVCTRHCEVSCTNCHGTTSSQSC